MLPTETRQGHARVEIAFFPCFEFRIEQCCTRPFNRDQRRDAVQAVIVPNALLIVSGLDRRLYFILL